MAVALFAGGYTVGRGFCKEIPTYRPYDFVGTYEWQWAGENWYGKIELGEQNVISRAKVGFLNKTFAPDGSERFVVGDKVIQLVNGSYSQKGQSKVRIEILVNKKVTGLHPELQQTIVGTLEARRCFAGQVEYHDPITGKRYLGDMILVDYCSHLGDEVDTWCAETN